MAFVKYFSLTNFRGAKKIQIPLSNDEDGKIITLIGLNESGKTTILDGLSLFPVNDQEAASIFKSIPTTTIESTMVPIHETGTFTGSIEVLGSMVISSSEWSEIKRIVRGFGYEIVNAKPIENIAVSKTFEFRDGDYVPEKFSAFWNGIELKVRKTRGVKIFSAEPNKPLKGDDKSIWNVVVDHLKSRLPHVVHFPNFVVNTPKKIYISPFVGESSNNSYYRRIIETVMSLTGDGLSLDTHVIKKIQKYRASSDDNWISNFMSSDERDKIDAVFSRLSATLTDEVIGAWSRIFNRPVAATRVEVRWSIDPSNGQPYVELRVSDGRSSYNLSQRSLGFRWFFCFLLFTRFGRDRTRQNIFLLDEPAANLHAKAQAELVRSFGRLAADGDIVIYSTHSHYMIEPQWLASAYIVENEAIDYDQLVGGQLSTRDTNIKITPYRRFVAENGSRVSYFQPVLDRLHHFEGVLSPQGSQLIVEGVSDFYVLSYVLSRSKYKSGLTILPGTGSGSLGTLISLGLAKGSDFFVLLDDDTSGQRAALKYKSQFFLDQKSVGTVGELVPEMKGKEIEDFLALGTIEKIREKYGNAKKETIGLYFAEHCRKGDADVLCAETMSNYLALIDVIASKLVLENSTD